MSDGKARDLLRQGEIIKLEEYLSGIKIDSKELVVLYILLRIFRWETKRNAASTVFDYSLELDELVRHFVTVKLYLRRLEFGLPEETWQEIRDYFHDTGVSDPFLLYLIQKNIFYQKKVCLRLAELFHGGGQGDGARAMLYRQMAQTVEEMAG